MTTKIEGIISCNYEFSSILLAHLKILPGTKTFGLILCRTLRGCANCFLNFKCALSEIFCLPVLKGDRNM